MEESKDFIIGTELPGVYIIKRPIYQDPRGFFRETFRKTDLDNRLGFNFNPQQANHSRSQKATLRGIHIAPWHKLVTVMHGQVQQVIVDLREESETFGQSLSVIMGEGNFISVLVPQLCGNAFLVLSDMADYTYLTTDYWAPGKEKNVAYNDKDLAIDWQITNPIVSEKDLANPSVRDVFATKFS